MADRPLECNQCKKPVKITYKEIVGDDINTIQACADCPVIMARLHKTQKKKNEMQVTNMAEEVAECPNCQMSSDAIKMGHYIGCSQCYQVFADLLVSQLTKLNKINDVPKKKSVGVNVALHKGKTAQVQPTETVEKLKELNSALDEAIADENFEQAAWLRDRINTAMEESSEEAI